jgi:hypothetical protein
MLKVFKNFLPEDHFQDIKNLFMSEALPWDFNDRVVSTENHFMFTHAFMDDGKVINCTLRT